MHKLVRTMANKIPNVVKEGSDGRPGVLYGGATTNLCAQLGDLEDEILAEIQTLQETHEAMSNGSGDPKKLNTFYLNDVSKINSGESEPFTRSTGPTQNWGMAHKFVTVPESFKA